MPRGRQGDGDIERVGDAVVPEKAPAFLFYVAKWRGSRAVQRMTFAERGMFLEMLCEQWEHGHLPDSPIDCAHLLGGTIAEWEAAWPTLRRKFVDRRRHARESAAAGTGRIVNAPLEIIRRALRASQRAHEYAGRSGGKAKARNRQSRETLRASDAVAPLAVATASLGSALANPSNKEKKERKEIEERKEEREIPRAHEGTVFTGSLPRDHRSHAYCNQDFTVCVPAAVHAKLIAPLSRKYAGDREKAHHTLLGWYAEISTGLAADFVPSDAFKFWQGRFDAAFATVDTPQPGRFGTPEADLAAVQKILGVKPA